MRIQEKERKVIPSGQVAEAEASPAAWVIYL